MKTVVRMLAVVGFVSLYEVTILDSRYASYTLSLTGSAKAPSPGARTAFTATAYCKGAVTTSGVAAQHGIAAADPLLLPVGSVVQIGSGDGRYDGIYTVLDTGPSVQGREIDLYIWSCNEALQFGRRRVAVTPLRLGWNPRATAPSFFGRLFGRTHTDPLPTVSPPPLSSADTE